jgi:DNA-binding IclR family transcriptional regulator
MKNKLSVREVVTRLIKTNGAMLPLDIINQADRPKAQVYTAISKLKSYGYLTRLDDGKYVLADPLGKQVEEKNLANRLGAARAEVDNLQKKLQEVTIKYYDTLAIVNYLESKINITRRT